MTNFWNLKGNQTSAWNYSNQQKEGYSPTLAGTVVEISNPQVKDFQTKQPVFWPDGNPKRQFCVIIKTQDSTEKAWFFAPRSNAMNAIVAALDPTNTRDQVSIKEILGKMVQVETPAGVYNNTNPRPWRFTILGDGDVTSVRGMTDLSIAQQQTQQPQAQPQAAPAPNSQLAQAQAQAAAALGFQQPMAAPQAQGAVAPQQVNGGGYADVYDQDIPF